MTIPEVEELRRALEGGERVMAVLVAGGDEAVREGVADAMALHLKRVASPVTLLRLDAEPARTDAWARLAEAAGAQPLFGEGTLALVSGCGSGAKVPAELTAFLAAPPGHLRVVLYADGKAGKGPLATKVAEVGKVVAPARVSDRQAGALVAQAAREAGITLEPRALDTLADLVGADRAAIETAVKMLAEFAGPGGRVAEADLAGLVQRSRRPAPWDLPDAILERNLPKALKIAARELDDAKDPRSEAIVLFHRIMRQVRTMRAAQALVDRKAPAAEAMERLGIKQDFKWDMTKRGLARFTAAELDACLEAAAEAETRLKRGHAGPEALVTDLLARLLSGGGGTARRRAQ